MVHAPRRFMRMYASDILVGFVVSMFTISIVGPAIAHADVATASFQETISQNASLPEAGPAAPRRIVRIEVSAYTSRPEETDSTPFITASGTHVHEGTVAANFLAFGTKVRIPELYGNKVFTVEDRMNTRYPHTMDIWMGNINDARQLGRRHVLIEVF